MYPIIRMHFIVFWICFRGKFYEIDEFYYKLLFLTREVQRGVNYLLYTIGLS